MPPPQEKSSLVERRAARPPEVDFRFAVAALLLGAAGVLIWLTIGGLSERRKTRVELAEISHARYGLLNVDVWVGKLTPILERKVDAFDLTAADKASLRPAVRNALYRLLDDIKQKMGSAPAQPPASPVAGLMSQANPLIVNMIVSALRPQVPVYADVVIDELARAENKEAAKKYVRDALATAAKSTFGNVDTRWYSSILKQHACPDAAGCREQLAAEIRRADSRIASYYLSALAATALGFILLLSRRKVLTRAATLLLLLFCLALLLGGLLTPMVEVEAKLTQVSLTLIGEKVAFPNQVLYFQSKSVLEVFDALIRNGKPDMWVVGVLVLTFSVVFPTLKLLTSALCLFKPGLLLKSRFARFVVLESSKWSMADVMALAIFMSFVAFKGLVTNTLGDMVGIGLPTDSSRILPGLYIFIGFCLASLFLSNRLALEIRASEPVARHPRPPTGQRSRAPAASG